MVLSNNKFIFVFITSAIFMIVFFAVAKPKADSGVMRIACGNDAAGILVARTAERARGVESEMAEGIDFLQLADCCGSQAEIALASGEFQMAVLCPDAAALFLEKTDDFVVVGGIIQNSNVLVKKTDTLPKNIGYMNGRNLQKEIISHYYNEAGSIPIMAAALPYALERDAVDGIVLDITGALKAGAYIYEPLPYDKASSVLVVKKDLIGTPAYKDFISAYNMAAEEANGNMLGDLIKGLQLNEDTDKGVDLWRTMQVRYLPIPNVE